MNHFELSRYDPSQTYEWNYQHAPDPVEMEVPAVPGTWNFCGLPVASPLGIPAGPLLNGRWCLYYASLGFDVLTYKTVRSQEWPCYGLPNLQPIASDDLTVRGQTVAATNSMSGSWAVSFGMPSRTPRVWRVDVEATRRQLPPCKRLVVSVVGTVQAEWGLEELAADYAQCARWAVEAGADAVETNLSCPNVSTRDGQLYQCCSGARWIVSRVREAIGNTPLVVKIGHITSPIEAATLVDAVVGIADGLSMVNCIAAQVVDDQRREMFDGEPRGIGGGVIREASLAQISLFRNNLHGSRQHGSKSPLALVGVGGISTAAHVASFLAHGASHVQMATAIMLDPLLGIRILGQLSDATALPLGGQASHRPTSDSHRS